jgi:lipopolysaccharide/colanic/teichoic acid biosynthesis glycosyltransferase
MAAHTPMTDGVSRTLWVRSLKRLVDVGASAILMIILGPVFLLIAIFVRMNLGSPVFFRQQRLGRHGIEFSMLKFRSMADARAADGALLPDALRLNAFGRFLRSSSLDELPQIVNILRGEMSFIGPRATLPIYRAIMDDRYPTRLSMLPGMTSLPAIKGRNSLTIDQKYAYDIEYVKKCSFFMDCYIAFMTIPVVLSRSNIEIETKAPLN